MLNLKMFRACMWSLKWRISRCAIKHIIYSLPLFLVGLYVLIIYFILNRKVSSQVPVNYTKRANILPFKQTSKSNAVVWNSISEPEYNQDVFSKRFGKLGNRGFLNVHTWEFSCELGLQNLVQSPRFPIYPNTQFFVDNLEIKWIKGSRNNVKKFGRRILGYLLVPYTGNFQFSMSSNCGAELWLSRDHHWRNSQLLCKSEDSNTDQNLVSVKRNSSEVYSSEIHLRQSNFYFIEVLITHIPQSSFHLRWKIPNSKNFEVISHKYLYSFLAESHGFEELIEHVPFTRATQNYITGHPKQSILSTTEKFHSGIKYLEWNDVSSALPVCPYRPGYVGKKVVNQYDILMHFVNPSYMYPEIKHAMLKEGKWDPWFPLEKKDAFGIVAKYLKKLGDSYPGKYKLKKILSVEKKPDWHKENREFYKGTLRHGDRFFLELLLWDNTNDKEVILSEYVYEFKNNKTLCYPEGMQWNKTVPVYLLISVRKQAPWVWHFIKNMERLYQSTADENLHVIVFDFNSTSIDSETLFQKSSFKNYKVLKCSNSRFHKTYALNRAADAVTDPNAIVFTVDLHLEIPPSFANSIRKHCIKGKMVFTPILARLSCGASPRYLHGAWDPWGYGMFGAYKTDWKTFDGFDEVKFTTRWGGEDWDLVERAYNVGLEFERIKIPDFYHYEHPRVGMWA